MRAPEFWRRDGLMPALLAPLGCAYAAAGELRRRAATPQRLPVPVVCIGNLVAGGAGKTPVAISVVGRLRAMGIDAHILSRGYGGRLAGPLRVDPARHHYTDVGDEALLLARAAPTWVARDRRAGGRAAVAAGAGAIVLDDGHQNPHLVKNLSMVVVDGGYGFGNGRVLPAGPLREPVGRGLSRAGAVVVLGEGDAPAGLEGCGVPVLRAALRPGPDAAALAGRPVVAFAGIGRPEKFFQTLVALGADLRATFAFADHHPYRAGDLAPALAAAQQEGASIVTTEKDAVRLPRGVAERVATLAISVCWQDMSALDGLLSRLMAGREGG